MQILLLHTCCVTIMATVMLKLRIPATAGVIIGVLIVRDGLPIRPGVVRDTVGSFIR